MTSRVLALVHATLTLALVAAAPTVAVFAKPDSAPVRVEYPAPAAMNVGDETTTAISFVALEDLDRLDVMVKPFNGVEVRSETTQATFANVRKGESRQLTVTVRLTEAPFGRLGVTYQTHQGSVGAAGATTIVYSTPRN